MMTGWRKKQIANLIEQEQFDVESVVRKCIHIVENLSPGYDDYRDQIEDAFRRDCVDEIKKQFGID